jgi:predicted ATPase
VNRDVFICHSSVDATLAREICRRLEASGVGCWLAPRDEVPGIPYGRQLVNAIAAARIVLLVFSSHANDSRAVLNELELASNRGKIILTVRIEDVAPSSTIEFYVRAIHWLDAASQPLERMWPQLIGHVKSLLAQPAPVASVEGTTAEHPTGGKPAVHDSNLPLQLTSFVGRKHDLAEIKKLLDEHRMVTLVGSGGSGKTRAAIEIGGDLLADFADGVWLVELATISDSALVAATIARSLSVRETPDNPLLDTLLDYLRDRCLLLIVDNCEHVIDEARRAIGAILRSCAGVRVLATSRESLNIAGEYYFRMPSLTVPPPNGKAISAKSALPFGAVKLFADRALAADARFRLTNDNAPAVTEICRRLDGMPLAIELAAARVKVLSPQELAQRLDERFRVLTGGDRSALPRHQTMRALIDWSYDLLQEQERSLFRKLSVFADGFSLRAASAICGDVATCDEIAVMDLLSSLVDKSLVQPDAAGEQRYRLLESTRQYAREKLDESGEAESTCDRHLEYVRNVFQKSGEEYETTMSGAAVTRLARELEDARNAFDWAVRRNVAAQAADLFLATRLWADLGLYREGIERAKQLVSLVDAHDSARLSRLWQRIALYDSALGNYAGAKESAELAMRYAGASNDRAVLADALLRYAMIIANIHNFDEALASVDQAEALAIPSMRVKVQVLHTRGVIASIRGDLDTASRCFTQVHELYVAAGNDAGTVSAALSVAETEHARGKTGKAIQIASHEISRAERLADRSMLAQMLRNLAGYLAAVNKIEAARRAASRAIAFYAASDPEGAFAAVALEHFALCLAMDGDVQKAAILEGYVERTLTRLGYEREYTEVATQRRLVQILAKELASDQLAALHARGEAMQASEALESVAPRAATDRLELRDTAFAEGR